MLPKANETFLGATAIKEKKRYETVKSIYSLGFLFFNKASMLKQSSRIFVLS